MTATTDLHSGAMAAEKVLIGAYGMFWQRDAVEWSPGAGGPRWLLLGRRGVNRPGLRLVDFRRAKGVYILFDHHGAYYVGLARGENGLGQRLHDHTRDEHKRNWQRFCWFALDEVADERDDLGLHRVKSRKHPVPSSDDLVIRELEALLITAMGTRGQRKMAFQGAQEWTQVPYWEEDDWIPRLLS